MIPVSDDTPDPKRSSSTLPLVQFSVDVSIVGDDEIAALNGSYRHKNKPTDVLSFSQWEGDLLLFAPEEPELPLPELPLGDLVISLDTAARQAGELKHSLLCELQFLAVHGTLHLLGYDHVRAADRRTMWRLQEEITEKLRMGN